MGIPQLEKKKHGLFLIIKNSNKLTLIQKLPSNNWYLKSSSSHVFYRKSRLNFASTSSLLYNINIFAKFWKTHIRTFKLCNWWVCGWFLLSTMKVRIINIYFTIIKFYFYNPIFPLAQYMYVSVMEKNL